MLVVATSAQSHADFGDSSRTFRVNDSWLRDAAFQERVRQRVLTIAQQKLESRDYSDAFEALHELLLQPADSASLPQAGSPIRGIHSTIINLLESLPPAAAEQWDATCQGPAARHYQRAIREGSQTILEDVIRDFPCCKVAADAHLLRATWLAGKGESHTVAQSLKALKRWRDKGLLSSRQRTALKRLLAVEAHTDSMTHAVSQPDWEPTTKQVLRTRPLWDWRMSSWDVFGGPNELPSRDSRALGSQFEHQPGSQPALLFDDAVIVRTPGGIARVSRDSGTQQWFLPFTAVRQDARCDMSETERRFELMPVAQDRLECDGETIYFLDGGAAGPVPTQQRFQALRSPRLEATRVVAIRNGATPAVLWWSDGLNRSSTPTLETDNDGSGQEYQFRIPDAKQNRPELIRQPEVPQQHGGHRFHSAPVAKHGRVYVTSRYEGLTYLNCLSASSGDLLWQQPLIGSGHTNADDIPRDAIVGGVIGNTIVCLFASGAVTGCSSDDGSIEWMQSVLFEQETDESTGDLFLSAQAQPAFIPTRGVGSSLGSLWLQVIDQRIICGRRGSPSVMCLNGHDGNIEWSASRAAADGMTKGQFDLGCVGTIGQNVILVGYSHCRALRVADGTQVWNRATGDHNGQAIVNGSRLYVGLNTRRLLVLDGHSGNTLQSQYWPDSRMGKAWAVDEQGLVTASAWRVASYPWTLKDELNAIPKVHTLPAKLIGRPNKVPPDLLQPDPRQPPRVLLSRASTLLTAGNREQAELVLLNMPRPEGATDIAQEREELLRSIRQSFLAPGMEQVQPIQLSEDVSFNESPTPASSFRLKEIGNLKRRRRSDRFRSMLPSWFRYSLMTDRTSNDPSVGLIDVERAIAYGSTKFDSFQFPANQASQQSWDDPGLILVERDNFVGVASLFNADPFAPLWLRQRPNKQDGEVLTLTSRRLLISDNDGITALHPLTGKLLWERRWEDKDSTCHLHGQYFKVYDIEQHVVLLSSLGTAYVVLNAQDGSITREADYEPGEIARIVGDQLLIVDSDRNLRATNLSTGSQRQLDFSNVSDVHYAGNVGRNMAAVCSEPTSITLIDLTDDQVYSNIETTIQRPNLRGPWMRPQIFRRSGLLYVAVSVRDWRARFPRPAFDEPQTGAGTLVCLDPESGQQLWRSRCETIAVPPIYGDPCPFLVTWSANRGARHRLRGFNNYAQRESLTITILDAFTGEVIAKTTRRSIGIPLRVTHDSNERKLSITFANTAIHMNYVE